MRKAVLALALALLVVVTGTAPTAAAGLPRASAAATADAPPLAADAPPLAADAPPLAADAPPRAADAHPISAETQFQTGGVEDAPRTNITVQLRNDTDARWVITTRYDLETRNDTEAFRRVVEEFETGNLETGFDAALFRNLSARVADSTGRSMAVTNVTREGDVENGTLTLRFTWTNFLERTADEKLRLRDAFQVDGNATWLSTLDPGQRLVIENPPGYTVPTSNYGVQNNTLVFEGPMTFERVPSVVYEKTNDPVQPSEEPPWLLVTGGIVLAAALVGGAYLVRQRREPRAPGGGDGDGTAGTEPAGEGGVGAATRNGAPEGQATAGRHSGGVEATSESVGADTTGVDFELLSDEERVEYLLRENGGRMRQASIVAETGWSDAKVSQLLSAMAEAGRVDKLRLGRENLISLPDEDEDVDDPVGETG